MQTGAIHCATAIEWITARKVIVIVESRGCVLVRTVPYGLRIVSACALTRDTLSL